jgi:hypothetical protein
LTISEIGEILRLQHSSQMVLVSYPEGGIQGVNSMLVTSIHIIMTTFPRAWPSNETRNMRSSLNWGWGYSHNTNTAIPVILREGDGRDMITLLYILDYSVY